MRLGFPVQVRPEGGKLSVDPVPFALKLCRSVFESFPVGSPEAVVSPVRGPDVKVIAGLEVLTFHSVFRGCRVSFSSWEGLRAGSRFALPKACPHSGRSGAVPALTVAVNGGDVVAFPAPWVALAKVDLPETPPGPGLKRTAIARNIPHNFLGCQ